jgi:GNAT superfamily N-acetyltransferase
MTYRKAEIRPLRAEDEPLLFGLAKIDRGADERTLEVLERETVFVAEVEGKPAGYVALEPEEARVRVDQLFVSPDHEAEGVGRQLLEYAEGYAIFRGARRLRVVVSESDARAVGFYRDRGFVSVEPDVLELVLPEP